MVWVNRENNNQSRFQTRLKFQAILFLSALKQKKRLTTEHYTGEKFKFVLIDWTMQHRLMTLHQLYFSPQLFGQLTSVK